MVYDKSPGTPYDRGSADAYYGHYPEPHYHKGMVRYGKNFMTVKEIEAYTAGYDEKTDRKLWG